MSRRFGLCFLLWRSVMMLLLTEHAIAQDRQAARRAQSGGNAFERRAAAKLIFFIGHFICHVQFLHLSSFPCPALCNLPASPTPRLRFSANLSRQAATGRARSSPRR